VVSLGTVTVLAMMLRWRREEHKVSWALLTAFAEAAEL
jgi:hypothetical protein